MKSSPSRENSSGPFRPGVGQNPLQTLGLCRIETGGQPRHLANRSSFAPAHSRAGPPAQEIMDRSSGLNGWNPLRLGTLNSLLRFVARHKGVEKEVVLRGSS